MLNAVLHGKAARIHLDGEDKTLSWRQLFNTREDLLTAAFFTRLSYLSHHACWRVLATALPPLREPPGVLRRIEFWPRWELHHRTVEPDMLLEFEHTYMLVEVKAPQGGGQSEDQWQRELQAFWQNVDDLKPLVFLAVGGLAADAQADVRERFAHLTLPEGQSVHGVGVSWQTLAEAVVRVLPEVDHPDWQILKDMLAACHLYGIYTLCYLDEWPPLPAPLRFSQLERWEVIQAPRSS